MIQFMGASPRKLCLVATGHRVDAPGRAVPRFPNTTEAVAAAREALERVVRSEIERGPDHVECIAGAANGTDLLFLEICRDLDVPALVTLATPVDDYLDRSVADGGSEWVEKYRAVCADLPSVVLEGADADDGVFERANVWMMEEALGREDTDVVLIAIWNGAGGDGPGGTAHMIEVAKSRGAKVVVLDSRELFGLS